MNLRQRVGLGLHALATIGLIPGYLLLSPDARWDDGVLLLTLAALAVITDHHDVPLPGGVSFDALLALLLVAVALDGPAAAFVIGTAPILLTAITRPQRALRAGTVANVAAIGWQSLAAWGALRALHAIPVHGLEAIGPLFIAGLAAYFVAWFVGPAIYAPLWLGAQFRTLRRALVDMAPAAGAMVLLGAITALLTGAWGLPALGAFAVIGVLPQSVLTYAARTRPVARLDVQTATRRYAHALAVQLQLSRVERRHLGDVLSAAERRPPTGDPLDYICATYVDPSPANLDAQVMLEWWDGRGPVGLRGEGIPLATRVVAIAGAWASLTAAGTREMSHADALGLLKDQAGARFDPQVLAAVDAVTAEERVTEHQPAPEPRLHRLRVPARMRRALAANV